MKFYESGEYRATKDWPFSIGAGCVVYKIENGKVFVLLLKRSAGDFPELLDGHIDSYHLPKGHMTLDESVMQTAQRETAEEAGCEVEIKTYLGARVNQYTDVGIKRDKIIHYFAGEWVKDLASIDHEHSKKLWVSMEDALKLVGSSNPKREDVVIERLKSFLELSS